MAPFLKTLLGNGVNLDELPDALRAILAEMQQERTSFENLVARLQHLAQPIARAEQNISELGTRFGALEQRLSAFEKIASYVQGLTDKADDLAKNHRRTETRVTHTAEDAERVRSQLEEIAHKAEMALCLKDDLAQFLDMEDPFRQLRAEADDVAGTVRGLFEEVSRLRTQHEQVVRGQQEATAHLSAYETQRTGLGRALEDKERRIAKLEDTLKELSELAGGVQDTKRELGTLKALTDYVTQKAAALEQQRDAVERAIDRADALDGLMRQVDAGLRQQQEHANALAELQARIGEVKRVQAQVAQRSQEIATQQREIDEQQAAMRQELGGLRDEARRTVDRFAFEKQGIDAVSQRIVDLRNGLADFEQRFRSLQESSQDVGAVQAQAESLKAEVDTLKADLAGLEGEAKKARVLRRELSDMDSLMVDARDRVGRIEEVRPALEAALRDFESLHGSHAMVKDALEQVRVAHNDISRMRDAQGETRTWLAGVQQSLEALRDQVSGVNKMRPAIDFAEKQILRVNEAISAIDARKEFVKAMHQRLTDLAALGGTLDERSQGLVNRMESAEQQFAALSAHADEAERLGRTISGVVAAVEDAERSVADVTRSVTAIEGRCGHVEGLAERMGILREEVEQRQRALEEGAKDLERASNLRQEAAAAAQELDARLKQLSSALSSADQQAVRLGSVSSQLEDRANALQSVEQRMGHFEERLTTWELAEREIEHALEQISGRQATVDALQVEIDRLAEVAERTASDVRTITHAHQEVEETRGLLNDVLGRLHEVATASGALDDRRRQMEQAEQRLARAEALLIDIRSSLEALQTQKVIVDHAVEKAGSLKVLLKQSEALIETLREEREVSSRLRSALAELKEDEDSEQEGTMATTG